MFWAGRVSVASMHRSRSLSISKYLPSYWLALFLASGSTGLSQLKSSWFMQDWIFLIDWMRPHMFPIRIFWGAAKEESQRRKNTFCSWQNLFQGGIYALGTTSAADTAVFVAILAMCCHHPGQWPVLAPTLVVFEQCVMSSVGSI